MVTTKPLSKTWNNNLGLTKLKLKFPQILNFANIFQGEMRGRQKWLLPLNINITILKSKLLSSIA